MAHMAMDLGEADFDMSDLPKGTLEHGDAHVKGNGNTPGRDTRLARRRARQRERRRWFRQGPQVRGSWADSAEVDERFRKELRQTLQRQELVLGTLSHRVQDLEQTLEGLMIRDLHAQVDPI